MVTKAGGNNKQKKAEDTSDTAVAGEYELYTTLGIQKSASIEEIKKAYRLMALKTHPDKLMGKTVSEQEDAKQVFQKVGFAYSILIDEKKREIYDKVGSVEDIDMMSNGEHFFNSEGKDWDAYFKELWNGIVDASTIEEFSLKYKGSEEEKKDIVEAYTNFDGDMNKILENVMLASVEEEDRIIGIIKNEIKLGNLNETKKFKSTISKSSSNKRRKAAAIEEKMAEKLREELGLDKDLKKIKKDLVEEGTESNDTNALQVLFQKRKAASMKTLFVEPSEEEFLALQEKLFKK
ncbi:hypothetical protein BB559_000447 [Furculomyces boomerangus]|uniref:J domain-containing protein n=1 Tax=Furculomyces boomerangus TaxID=61424 RepID=A0A2T9Z599_9FUNG|nr:hypothetical protein BB559_000447 [Furculomyces boomerangus]